MHLAPRLPKTPPQPPARALKGEGSDRLVGNTPRNPYTPPMIRLIQKA